MSQLVLTLIADDRAGIVETIADVVKQHSGNWLESRMVALSGKFAGLLSVEVSNENKQPLIDALAALSEQGITIVAVRSEGNPSDMVVENWLIDIMGQDAPGIIQEISRNIGTLGGNVVEISSERAHGSMTGEMMFQASYAVYFPESADLDEVQTKLENVSFDLSVEVSPII